MVDEDIPMDRLAALRDDMMVATEQFVAALNKRGAIALAIAEENTRRGIQQIRDEEREKVVLKHVASISEGPFSSEVVRQFVQAAMDAACELQADVSGITINYQGATAQPADPMLCQLNDKNV